MSKLQDLINELCPNGVEFKPIKEICISITSGGTPLSTKNNYYNGDIPWLRTQEVNWQDIYDTEIKITEEGVINSSAKWIKKNCVIIAMYGATAGKVCINKIPLTTNQACCNLEIDSKKALYKYVYYCLSHEYKTIKSKGRGSQSNINSQIIRNFKIPVPPLQIQEEIVRILDLMSEVSIKLTSEYILRSKQYQYYLDSLFSIEKTINISKICQFKRGKGLQKSDFDINGKLGCIHYGQIYTKYGLSTKETISRIAEETSLKCTPVEPNNIVIACTSENVEDICKAVVWEGSSRIFTGGHSIVCSTSYEPRYVAYFLKSTMFQKQKRKLVYGTKVIEIKTSSLEKIQIPDVSKEEQRKVVDLLDKFDSYVNDLFFGIPAEIEARKKQYEFYRDKLLTFKEVKN